MYVIIYYTQIQAPRCEGYAGKAPSGGKTARSAESDIVGGAQQRGEHEFMEEKSGEHWHCKWFLPNFWKSTVFDVLYSRLLVMETH